MGFFHYCRSPWVVVWGMLLPSGWAQAERCAFPSWHQKFVQQQFVSERPQLPFAVETPDGRFRLHYALDGPDAVPAFDGDGNGVPDYVDTAARLLQYVFTVLVDSLGYPPPPSDGGAGGSEAYDVYFVNLGVQGLYGETVPERLLPKGVLPRFTSFLKLDNDYSPADSFGGRPTYRETGIRALRVAMAHEFYHAIQFGNYGIARQGILLYELASTFMEWRLFPDTRDYEQFLPDLFQRPEQCVFGDGNNAALGYRFAPFGQYLYLRWGDGVLRRMWEHIGMDRHPYAALDTALWECAHVNLAEAWCTFLPWLYYTGMRARPGYFPQAAEFPMVRFAVVEHFTPPTVMSSGQLRPFEFRFLRVFFPNTGQTPDTLDLALSAPNMAAVLANQQQGVAYTVVCGASVEGEPLGGTLYRLQVRGEGPFCRQLFWNGGLPVAVAEEVYPQPYVVGLHTSVCLPVPATAMLEEQGEVELYTVSWVRAVVLSARVRVQEQRLVCCVGPLRLEPGVYTYRLTAGGQQRWGKLLVQQGP